MGILPSKEFYQGYIPNSAIHKAVGSLVTSHSQKAIPKKPSAGMPPRHCSCQWLLFAVNGHFSVTQELYQSKSWNGRELCEARSFVNSAVNIARLTEFLSFQGFHTSLNSMTSFPNLTFSPHVPL